MAVEGEATRLNNALVDSLLDKGVLTEQRLVAAFRAVQRHHFLPRHQLADVYRDRAIATRLGPAGEPISSSSQPSIMAIMLEQLGPQPGSRVLEVGTGTGYTAALLSRLVAPGGKVTTLDIDAEVCAQARERLAAPAAAGPVAVEEADALEGWAPGAPYDRILVTAAIPDVAPAWFDQLAIGGRLVAPLDLGGPVQLASSFVRRRDHLAGLSASPCGFMPLRGAMTAGPDALAAEPRPGPGPALEMALGAGQDSGRRLPADLLRTGFESWLALTCPGYLAAPRRAGEERWFGLADPGGAVTVREQDGALAIWRHGEAEPALGRLLAAQSAWRRTQPGYGWLRIDAYPAGASMPAGTPVIRRPRFSFAVRWP